MRPLAGNFFVERAARPWKIKMTHSDFEQRLQNRKDAHHAQRDRDLAELFGALPEPEPMPDLAALPSPDARLAALDAWMERRIHTARSVSTPPSPETSAGARVSAPLTPLAEWLGAIDHSILADFFLRRFDVPLGLSAPTRVCETAEAFLAPIVDTLELNRDEANRLRRSNYTALDSFNALHIPGRGCFINAPALARQYHKTLGGLHHDADVRIHILREVAQAKWGWGFLCEYTTLGNKLVASKLWATWLAQSLGLHLPRFTHDADRLAAIQHSWLLTETGWRTWVWEYLAYKARTPVTAEPPPRSRMSTTLDLVGKIAVKFPEIIELSVNLGNQGLKVIGLVSLFRFLFIEQTGVAPHLTHLAIKQLQALAARRDGEIEKSFGVSLRTLAGRLYLSKIEATVGSVCVPYALMLACHHTYTALDSAAITRQIETLPLANVDTRLAMLVGLDPAVKYDPARMELAAREKCGIEGPREYFGIR